MAPAIAFILMFAVMAGIYIHIPFCRKACHYCNFHFATSFKSKDELVRCLLLEIEMQRTYLTGDQIETIYFGGGTPSAIPAEDISAIVRKINDQYLVADDVEITLEANPDDIHLENLYHWKSSGINRLSIGIQAFQEELLRDWNRSHNAVQAYSAIKLVQKAELKNITADLIYGGPGLTDEAWIFNIQNLIDLGIPHISCYALTVEAGTAMSYFIEKGKVIAPDDDQANRQYSILQTMLISYGYEQYEVSNFAKPGFESKHNMSYWSGANYLGLGPSAHSFNGISRQWNIANNVKYIHQMDQGEIPYEKEELTDNQRYNEIVMTGLRTTRGIDMGRIGKLGTIYSNYLDQHIQKFVAQGKVIKNEFRNWALNPESYFFADGIAADLFFE